MDPSERLTKTKSTPPLPADPGRKVLITGGAGFLGVNAAIHLIKDGWHVSLLDNLSRPGTERNLKWLITKYPDRLTFIKEDVRNAGALAQHVKDQDAILHLAGQVAVTTSLVDPVTDFDVNARGTLNMLEAVRVHNRDAPFVFASTNKVYGKLDHNNAACKETPADRLPQPVRLQQGRRRPVCPRLRAVLRHEHGRPSGRAASTAPTSTGPRTRVGSRTSSIPSSRTALTIYGDGKQVSDLLDARDLSALYATAINKIGKTSGEIYNVGGGPQNQRNLLEVIDQIGELTHKTPQFTFTDWREGDQQFYVSDVDKARSDLGWEPRVDFDKGLRDLISWAQSVS